MGKVSHPHCSGVLTTSFVISLHDLQTEPQATTSLRAGHEVSLSSTRWIMSSSNSGGKFAHRPWWTNAEDDDDDGNDGEVEDRSGAIGDFVRRCECLPSTPLRDMFPMPSLISLNSRTMLLKGIVTGLSTVPLVRRNKEKKNQSQKVNNFNTNTSRYLC